MGQAVRAGGDIRMLVPIETVAGKCRRVSCVAVAHRQVQRHHTVSTARVRERVRQTVRTGGDIVMFVPIETVAGKRRRVTRVAVAHGQMQGHHAVATGCIGECVRQVVAAGGDIRMLVPVETVARERRRVTRVAVAHRQMQCHHRVATRCVRERVRQAVCAGGDIRMLVPVETVTSKCRRVARVAMTHRQVQGHHTVATGRIGERMGQAVRAGGDIGMLIPVKTVTSKCRSVARVAMTHRQVQGHHRVATARIRERVRQAVCAGGDVRILIPVETVARERRRVACVAVAHRQVQRHHAVATGCVRERVRQTVRTGRNVRMFVPVEAVARKRRRVARVAMTHRQVQRHHRVATGCVRERVRQ